MNPSHTNPDAEQRLLGGIFANPKALERVAAMLRPDQFSHPLHARIFEASVLLQERGQGANPITLMPLFKTDPALIECGGVEYLARLSSSAVSINTAALEGYARAIVEMAERRQLADELQRALEAVNVSGYEVTSAELAHSALKGLEAIGAGKSTVTIQTRREVMLQVVEAMKAPPPSDSTGIHKLDMAMGGGLFPGRSYGFAARLKAGKTTLLGTISYNLNESGVPHLYIAGEMSAQELEHRSMARAMNTNSLRFLRRESVEFSCRAAEYALQAKSHVSYVTAPGITAGHLKRVMAVAVRKGVRGIIFDYLQLTQGKGKGQSTAEFYDEVAQGIANYARQEGIWAMVACQLNQDENTRGGEGIKLAFDQVYKLKREAADSDPPMAWLEMMASRYTSYASVGTENEPALILDPRGPHFREIGQQARGAA